MTEEGQHPAPVSWREEYAELGGWEAESDASRILQGLGIGTEAPLQRHLATLDARLKVKVLLAQALFGNPDILLLDEATNNLGHQRGPTGWRTSCWTSRGPSSWSPMTATSLNTICTHIVDIDYNKIKLLCGQLRLLV